MIRGHGFGHERAKAGRPLLAVSVQVASGRPRSRLGEGGGRHGFGSAGTGRRCMGNGPLQREGPDGPERARGRSCRCGHREEILVADGEVAALLQNDDWLVRNDVRGNVQERDRLRVVLGALRLELGEQAGRASIENFGARGEEPGHVHSRAHHAQAGIGWRRDGGHGGGVGRGGSRMIGPKESCRCLVGRWGGPAGGNTRGSTNRIRRMGNASWAAGTAGAAGAARCFTSAIKATAMLAGAPMAGAAIRTKQGHTDDVS